MVQEIPKVFHFVWVGDQSLEPTSCIETWKTAHPDWKVKVWRNSDWESGDWINRKHMDAMAETGQLCGVADLLRWEILLSQGGIALDADSVCLHSLPAWMLACEIFACWENEVSNPGLISNGLVGAKPGNPVILHIVESLSKRATIATRFSWKTFKRKSVAAWKVTGPSALTKALEETRYTDFSIFPSHFFIPEHYSGRRYTGHGPIYCTQLYAGTRSSKYYELPGKSAKERALSGQRGGFG